MSAISDIGSLEDLLDMGLGLDSHVLLSKGLRVLLEVCVLL